MHALRGKEGDVITNTSRIIKAAEEFCTDLYSSRCNQDDTASGSSAKYLTIPPVKKEEIVLKAMRRGAAVGKDKVTTDQLTEGKEIVLEILPTLYTQCLVTSNVP